MEYKKFENIINDIVFKSYICDLIKKIANNPDRYIGIFGLTTPKTKIIQNLTQSREIKFGDALEKIFEEYFIEYGFEILNNKISNSSNNEKLNIDQLIKKDNIIYMIEQKVRDDHDSTKKRGQFDNFRKKYEELKKIYNTNKIVSIMWFIDNGFTKNKKFYMDENEKLNDINSKIYYGKELFKMENDFNIEIWDNCVKNLKKYRSSLKDIKDVNFDLNSDEIFEELINADKSNEKEYKDFRKKIKKIFSNQNLSNIILPILFPKNLVPIKLADYYNNIDFSLSKSIKRYIDNNPSK